MKFTKKKECRCCKSTKLIKYLDLGKQPLANSYHKGKKLPVAPLEVMICKDCFHNQLSIVVDPDDMFLDYLYVSGTTKTFQEHTRRLAKDALKRFSDKRLKVMDVACNDGTQLEYFRQMGCEVYGVDPAKNLRVLTREKKIPVVVDYWTQKVAKRFENNFDILTGTNVFAHVDDVDEFLNASKIAIKNEGLIILEFPYGNSMVSHNEFDTVYHEHLSYFLVNSFSNLVNRLDLSIVDIVLTPIHGGSIRFFLKKGKHKKSNKVQRLITEEKNKGLLSLGTYKKYSKNVTKNKKDMKKLLGRLKKENKKVIGYGASAKGNTMLNYFKINLSYTIDDNPLKVGYLTPGRNIPIKSSRDLAREQEDVYVVILAWNFYNEITKRILDVRPNKKDFAIVYVPRVAIRSLREKNKYIQSA